MIIVDTPGTNVILQRQQKLTEEFVPRADLLLFVMSADRPLTESEVQFCHFYDYQFSVFKVIESGTLSVLGLCPARMRTFGFMSLRWDCIWFQFFTTRLPNFVLSSQSIYSTSEILPFQLSDKVMCQNNLYNNNHASIPKN